MRLNACRMLQRLVSAPIAVICCAVFALWLAACFCGPPSAIAATYPANTGRVTDAAGIIDAATQTALITKLKALEDKSGIQLVVGTVKSLEGNDIAPYATALFRFWKLGEAAKNNGALLLIAPNERKVRIEVGYGLEGTLTDAVSKIIITNAIAPRFKAGDFAGGVTRGVDDIITTLTADAAEWHEKTQPTGRELTLANVALAFIPLLIFACPFVVLFLILQGYKRRHIALGPVRRTKHRTSSGKWVTDSTPGASSSNSSVTTWSSGSSSSSSDSFSGGGGSSGGGGASGDW
jgi:uncharacterized protein